MPDDAFHGSRLGSRPDAGFRAGDRLAASLHAQLGELPPEEVLQIVKPESGLRCIIAIDSTARGAALGGCRLLPYGTDQEALLDALRLARAMSMKNALADLPFGGGHAVICRPPGDFDRSELFAAFGRTVASVGDCHVATADAGTTVLDMLVVQRQTTFASAMARHRAANHSSKTAFGVFIAIEEGLQRLKRRLRGATVAVQGLGSTGMSLCERLHDSGARLVVADVDPARALEAAARFDARIVEPGRILAEPCDVLAPCALGDVFDADTIATVRAAIVCGTAANQLADPTAGDGLHALGVLYLPDYLVNVGGAIGAARACLEQGSEAEVVREVALIGRRVNELLERSGSRAPVRAADDWAREKLATGVRCDPVISGASAAASR
jgi:leucine dehydrogenase